MAAWKVIIADDEPIIRAGIRETVDWPALDMEVVAEAEDGEEALEQAVALRPDLLLVDLNMPIVSGIAVVEQLRRSLPECRVVIVTGHDEFAYAQQAIRLGVDEYILKPTNPQQLAEVLGRIKAEMEQSWEKEKHLKMASQQISKNIPLLRERFCNEWIEGAIGREEALEQLRFLGLPQRAPALVGILRWPEVDLGRTVRPERERQLMLFAMENIALELLSPSPAVLFRDPAGFLCAFVWEMRDSGLFASIEEVVDRYLKLRIVAYAEPVAGGESGVAAAYQKAREAVYKEASVSPLVRRARRYVRERYADPQLSLEGTARAIGVSPVYLSRLIKQELGTTFVALLTQTRIAEAIRLLNGTDRSIADIAEAVGYESQHYFSTAFKKAVGVPPIRFRKGTAAEEGG